MKRPSQFLFTLSSASSLLSSFPLSGVAVWEVCLPVPYAEEVTFVENVEAVELEVLLVGVLFQAPSWGISPPSLPSPPVMSPVWAHPSHQGVSLCWVTGLEPVSFVSSHSLVFHLRVVPGCLVVWLSECMHIGAQKTQRSGPHCCLC